MFPSLDEDQLKEVSIWLQEDLEIMCPMNDNKVPREWLVIRRDWQESFSAYKMKSQLFLTYETKQIDEGKEDTEEAN